MKIMRERGDYMEREAQYPFYHNGLGTTETNLGGLLTVETLWTKPRYVNIDITSTQEPLAYLEGYSCTRTNQRSEEIWLTLTTPFRPLTTQLVTQKFTGGDEWAECLV